MTVPSESCASAPDRTSPIGDLHGDRDGRDGDLDATSRANAPERRASGRRARARDRLLDRGIQPTQVGDTLERVRDIENLLLFVDDDIRETALAMQRIEDYLTRATSTLDHPTLRREHVLALAGDERVLDHLDRLSETLESLRRRLARLAASMK